MISMYSTFEQYFYTRVLCFLIKKSFSCPQSDFFMRVLDFLTLHSSTSHEKQREKNLEEVLN